ncbi:MAG: hypothetical protein Q8T03_12030 [Bacteroidota bacterium]|nr:hypothetical protein [Bacteroidota bacterium]
MKHLGKIIIGTSIGAGVITLVSYLASLKKTGDELETDIKSKVTDFNIKKGITLTADVLLKNPSKRSLKFKHPTIKVLHKNKVIATSKVINKDYVLPEFGEKQLDPITITVPPKDLLSMAGGLFQLVTNKVEIPLAVKVITSVDLGFKKQDFSKTQDLTIKPKQA